MISAETRAEALRLLASGVPQREVARLCGISKGTAANLAKAAKAVPAAPAPASPLTPAAPAEARPSARQGARAEEVTRHAVDHALELAERSAADGNLAAAQRFTRDAIAAAHDLARIEREQRAGSQYAVQLTHAQIEAAKTQITERMATLAAAPLTCRECGRKLRMAAVADARHAAHPL